MMLLGVDAESTGLLRPDLSLSDDAQPHIQQLAAIAFDGDWNVVGDFSFVIKPRRAPEAQAEAVHGISVRDGVLYGIPLANALAPLQGLVNACSVIFGFNLHGFDRKLIESELLRMEASGDWWRKASRKMLCVMEEATAPCAIPSEFGFKHPTLEEAVSILCPDTQWKPRHSAKHDVLGTAHVLRALIERGTVDLNKFGGIL